MCCSNDVDPSSHLSVRISSPSDIGRAGWAAIKASRATALAAIEDLRGSESGDLLDARDAGFIRDTLPLYREIVDLYFRAEVRGLERIPAEGPVLVVGNHSGGFYIVDTFAFVGPPFGVTVFDLPARLPLPAKLTIQALPKIDLRERFGDDPDEDEVYAAITADMQAALDELAAERRLPVIG